MTADTTKILRQEPVTKETLGLVIDVWQTIFPKEKLYFGFDGMNCFEYSLRLDNIGNHRYYLYYLDDTVVGMSGLYDEPYEVPRDSVWLGWYGVLAKHRNHGYGTQILGFFESEAKQFGYKFCRVYTDDRPENTVIQFYEANGYTFEKYTGEAPSGYTRGVVTVGSKVIGDKPLKLWNNRKFYFD